MAIDEIVERVMHLARQFLFWHTEVFEPPWPHCSHKALRQQTFLQQVLSGRIATEYLTSGWNPCGGDAEWPLNAHRDDLDDGDDDGDDDDAE